MTDITTAELRKSLGEIFDRVLYNGASYVVTRKGRAIGAIIPVELANRLQDGQAKARDRLLDLLNTRKDLNRELSDDEVMDLAVSEVDKVRETKTGRQK